MGQANSPVYEIRVQGVLGETFLSAFPALTRTSCDGSDTVLAGCLDQAALHGVLHEIESLGLKLLAVNARSNRSGSSSSPFSGPTEDSRR